MRKRKPWRGDRIHAGGEAPELGKEPAAQPLGELGAEEGVGGNAHHERPERFDEIELSGPFKVAGQIAHLTIHDLDILLHLPTFEPG